MAELKIDFEKMAKEFIKTAEERGMRFVPLSVIEDIRAEIKSQMDDDDYFCGASLALQIIEKHISGKENDGQTKT